MIKVAVIALFLSQVSSQNPNRGGDSSSTPAPSGGSGPSSAMSPKYERIGKYEVASPDSVS